MWKVAVGDEETSAVYEPANGEPSSVTFVCAHGAGGNMSDAGMLRQTTTLRDHGFNVVRFNFLYKERKRGRIDPMPLLMETTSAVVERTRAEVAPNVLLIGGRSMGGRAASMLAADGFSCDGLFLLAYPLHPAGRPQQLRDAHLPQITVPVLCVNGTRDALCTRTLMEGVLERVRTPWTMHWIDGADHSFHVLRSSGRTDSEVLKEIGETGREWSAPWRNR